MFKNETEVGAGSCLTDDDDGGGRGRDGVDWAEVDKISCTNSTIDLYAF